MQNRNGAMSETKNAPAAEVEVPLYGSTSPVPSDFRSTRYVPAALSATCSRIVTFVDRAGHISPNSPSPIGSAIAAEMESEKLTDNFSCSNSSDCSLWIVTTSAPEVVRSAIMQPPFQQPSVPWQSPRPQAPCVPGSPP